MYYALANIVENLPRALRRARFAHKLRTNTNTPSQFTARQFSDLSIAPRRRRCSGGAPHHLTSHKTVRFCVRCLCVCSRRRASGSGRLEGCLFIFMLYALPVNMYYIHACCAMCICLYLYSYMCMHTHTHTNISSYKCLSLYV